MEDVKLDVAHFLSGETYTEYQLVQIKNFLVGSKPSDLICAPEAFDGRSIIESIFPSLYLTLQGISGTGQSRIVCCDALSVWFLRSCQISSKDQDLKNSLNNLISDEVATFLFKYIIDFLESSGGPFGNSLRELLSKLINYLKKGFSHEYRDALYKKWLELNFSLPHTSRTLYFISEVLFKEFSNPSFVIEEYPFFVDKCITIMWSNALANSSGKALSSMYRYIYNDYKKGKSDDFDLKWLMLWDQPVKNGLTNPKLRKNIQVYLLPLLFKISLLGCREFIKSIVQLDSILSDDELDLLIGCLKVAQDLAIIEEPFHGDDALITIDCLHDLLACDSSQFRIAAYALLTSSPRGSKTIQSYVYDLIRDTADVFYVESDLEVRNDFYSLTRQFIARVRDSAYALDRDYKKLISKNMIEEADLRLKRLNQAQEFMKWQLNYLYDQIRPGTSYQRLNLGFKMLSVLIKSGLDIRVDEKLYDKQHLEYPFSIPVYDSTMIRLLIDNVTNDFEDIREQSVELLLSCPLEVIDPILNCESIDYITKKATDMLGDVKGRRGDGGARILQFLFKYLHIRSDGKKAKVMLDNLIFSLKDSLHFAETDLATCVYEKSVHGYFTSLKLIIEIIDFNFICSSPEEVLYYESKISDIIENTIFKVWDIVKSVLTHDSLEGNLPDEMQDLDFNSEFESKYGPATQIILSYSWRAIKESTSLLGLLLNKAPESFLDNSLTLKSGAIILEQLASVRHRGAFSSVYPTFISCCERCIKSKNVELQNQPKNWLKHNIELIKNTTQYISRRSGGLPFSTTAILIASKSDQKLMAFAFEELLKIADKPYEDTGEEKLDIPQVHAFNCIKYIFIESHLSEQSSLFVNRALRLCLQSFASDTWAIRNCAVMLFTALQNRLFGTKKLGDILPSISSRLFFSKYDGVKSILLNNLQNAIEGGLEKKNNIEVIFPVLTILSRLECTSEHDELEDFLPLLSICLESSHWKVREMAARALSSITYSGNISSVCVELLRSCITKRQNHLHGKLLALSELLHRTNERLYNIAIAPEVYDELTSKCSALLVDNNCWATAKCYTSILAYILKLNRGTLSNMTLNILGNFLFLHITREYKTLDGSLQLLLANISEIVFKEYLKRKDFQQLVDFIQFLLFSNFYEVQICIIKLCNENIEVFTTELSCNIIESLWLLIEDKSTWSYIASSTLNLLQRLLTSYPQEYRNADLCNKIEFLLEYTSTMYSEDVRATALEALGPFSARLVLQDENDERVKAFLKLAESFGSDDMPFQMRFSSLKALSSFSETLGTKDDISVNCARAYFDIYEAASDDDEEIRVFAAKTLSQLLGLRSVSVPIYVSKLFCQRFNTEFHENGWTFLLNKILKKRNSISKSLLYVDKVLFTTEKSNFYRDNIKHSRDLNRLILSFGDRITFDQMEAISEIISNDLAEIIDLIKSQKDDGWIGWTKEEIFYTPIISTLDKVAAIHTLKKDAFVSEIQQLRQLTEEYKLHSLVSDKISSL